MRLSVALGSIPRVCSCGDFAAPTELVVVWLFFRVDTSATCLLAHASLLARVHFWFAASAYETAAVARFVGALCWHHAPTTALSESSMNL